MPDWSITITQASGKLKFTPDPLEAEVNDTVSWANESGEDLTVTTSDGFTDSVPKWKSNETAYVLENETGKSPTTYTCKSAGGLTGTGTINVTALFLCLLLLGLFGSTLRAQSTSGAIDCGPIVGKPLQPLPEINNSGTQFVRGTMVTAAALERIAFVQGTARQSGSMLNSNGTVNTNMIKCFSQWVRAYSKDAPRGSQASNADTINPLPGPIIRARVGNLVELTFLNLIETLRFPRADMDKCDQTTKYPANVNDKYPDCFNESTITNVHFHGTHTNPSSTGDNVFLLIKPSPRSEDAARTPAITAASVAAPFKAFFDKCEAQLPPVITTPKQWPRLWSQAPPEFTQWADSTVAKYAPDLFQQNQRAVLNGAWPQNYVGAVPYCYPLPQYTSSGSATTTLAAAQSPHTHGAGEAEVDETQDPVRPLVMGQAPGTHWYHAHKHGSTTINVSNGMTGVMIIEGEYDDYIKSQYPKGITQQVLVIQQLGGLPNLERGAGGPDPYFSVNGQLQPTISMKPGEVQWWRIANTSSRAGAYFCPVTFVNNAPVNRCSPLVWKQLAQDGVQFSPDNYSARWNNDAPFLLASGNRADILIQAPTTPGTYPVYVYNSIDAADRTTKGTPAPTPLTLLNVIVPTGSSAGMSIIQTGPPMPPFLSTIQAGEVKATRTLVFSTNVTPTNPIGKPGPPGLHEIDGQQFDGNVGAAVVLNQVEEWKVVNETYPANNGVAIAHPFHIHINPFQLTEVFAPNSTVNNDGVTPVYITSGTPQAGQCLINPADPTTWHPCAQVPPPSTIWWDVFPIPSGKVFGTTPVPGYFKMRSRFVDYSGYYVLHCHILAHEDRGMMTVVYVTPLQPPFSHH